jgi:hypothetical protein
MCSYFFFFFEGDQLSMRQREMVYVAEMPKDSVIICKDMILVGTGEKYHQGVKQHERVLSKKGK